MNAGRKSAGYALDGIFGGFVFAFVQMLEASVSKQSALFPFEAAASTVLGRKAFLSPSGVTVAVGLAVYLTASIALGFLYHRQREIALLSRILTSSGRLRPSVMGLGFGLVLWAFVSVAVRIVYPWLAEAGPLYSFWMFAAFFGWPLGVFAARTERRQPVELKIVYSASAEARPEPNRSAPRNSSVPAEGRRPEPGSVTPSTATTRPAGKTRRKLPLAGQKRPVLRLLVKTGDSGPGGRDGGGDH